MHTTFINLSELRNALRDADDLPAKRRANMASALASFAKSASHPLESLPMDPVRLRPLISSGTWPP